VKLPEEATQLLNEVEIFLKPGETRQDERIREISKLAVELYGKQIYFVQLLNILLCRINIWSQIYLFTAVL
jgi:hypothetical protein